MKQEEFDDINALFESVRAYAAKVRLPVLTHDDPFARKLGFIVAPDDPLVHRWFTISLTRARASLMTMPETERDMLSQQLRTAAGREVLARSLSPAA